MAKICLDASFVIAMLVSDESSEAATRLWDRWSALGTGAVAPPILVPEVTSVLRNQVYRGQLSTDQGESAFRRFCEIPITIVQDPNLHEFAWELARRFNRPRAYDAVLRRRRADGELRLVDGRQTPGQLLPPSLGQMVGRECPYCLLKRPTICHTICWRISAESRLRISSSARSLLATDSCSSSDCLPCKSTCRLQAMW